MKIHQKYMLRCIEIAQNGLGSTAPNPMVGAVIVNNGIIIGEGFTSPYGGPHAEVNAIQSVLDTSLLKEATLYVTLEPCSHFGKTPPCADLIIKHKIQSVVIGILDPHDKVAGKGIQKLKDAGCNVTTGVLEQECRKHHKRFLTFHKKKRPYIILKWAETLDGFIAPEKEKRNDKLQPYWITSPNSLQMVHQWRAEEQTILVGTNTVLEDNPKLDVRHWEGESPSRIVLDRNLKIRGDYHVLDGSIPTVILTEVTDTSKHLEGITYKLIDFKKDIGLQIATTLWEENFNSVLIEGGSKTLQTFIDAGLWDEARVFTGNTNFKKGIKAPEFSGKLISSRKIERDHLKIYRND
ncbi:bifunctional diaminohydroxyphosphoribosylaminopyrimidine deaminase/5-amino-6-(5-phosphoribosylamino)uracil reductase RibD [Maribacter sp. 2308TA10-17]|uniref:bifunctional diaminohydroxyphosphoribosylaminopyrimidine deaminase/5-amino-6-(5-phosphoribosylamino)uracil reductase RibD n=1 Tax=Maribacter sp. 2308TA10-17 TaxID=3386276 RepID=UPI0039BCD9A8